MTESLADAVIRLGQLSLQFGRVNRATFHEDGTTPESDTDHTVMLGLVACGIADRLYPNLDRGLIAQYALVHDLVEVYAGDTVTLVISEQGQADKDARELAALRRLSREFFVTLPWVPMSIGAYEDRVGPEARFVKAVDKMLPKITHLLNAGATIAAHGLTAEESVEAWRKQRVAMQEYAADFPEVLDLIAELADRVADTYQGPAAARG